MHLIEHRRPRIAAPRATGPVTASAARLPASRRRPGLRAALLALAAAAALAAAPGVRAGMFDDDEARRAILDLRTRLDQEQQANRDLRTGQEQMRQSLLDLNNEIQTLRGEIARLRGQDEQLTRDVAELQRRQKDIAQGVDERVRRLEPQRVSIDGKEFNAEPEERRVYEDAINSFRTGDFAASSAALTAAMARYPSSGYVDSATFWLGNAQYGLRLYKDAIATFRRFATNAPAHPRAPEAWLSIANCYAEMKDRASARKALEDLIRQYPDTEAATTGRERLAALR